MTRNTAVAQADELRTFFTRVRPYYRELFNMAHAVCGNYEVAEYAVQSAMLEVFRRGTPRSRAGLRETLRAQTRSMALEQARLIDDAELTWDGFRADAIEGAGGDLVLQAASINLFGKAIMLGLPDDAPLFWGAAVLGLLCLAADVEVLRAVGRLRLRELEARRVARMSRAVEELSAGARREMDALEEVAMLRHDARNHLQVLTSLIERGQRGEAASYARALSATLSSRGEKNVVADGAPGDVGSEP